MFLECSLVFTLCYARSQQSALTDSVHTSPHSIYKCFSRSSRQTEVRRARDKSLCLSGWLVGCAPHWSSSLASLYSTGFTGHSKGVRGTFSSIDPRPNFICYSCQEVNCQAVQKACIPFESGSGAGTLPAPYCDLRCQAPQSQLAT